MESDVRRIILVMIKWRVVFFNRIMKDTRISQRLVPLLVLATLLSLSTVRAEEGSCRELIGQRIEAAVHPLLLQPDFSLFREPVGRLYQPDHRRPLWFQGQVPTPQALAVASRLSRADDKGLRTEQYEGAHWSGWLASTERAPFAAEACREWMLDLALSVSVMRYVSDLRVGRVDPRQLKYHLDVKPKKYDLATFLVELAGSQEPRRLLDRVEPPFQRYRTLLAALERYRGLARDAELNRPLPVTGKSLRPGESYPELGRLAYRLERWGDLEREQGLPAEPESQVGETGQAVSVEEGEESHAGEPEQVAAVEKGFYGGELVEAVKRFQGRHGLEQDGIIGRNTFAQLNVPMTERVEQIRLTLERWRWMPDRLGYRPIVINVPEYKLYAFEDDGNGGYRQVLDMEVIVGESYPRHQTPLFRSAMRYIVFSPYWNVPYNILKRELYAKIEADPQYLVEHNYQIVDAFHPAAKVFASEPENIARLLTGKLKLRQTPGAHNALGAVKFIFPNDHSVYLHGTPAKRLFKKDRRDFSHGCIRISDPPRLAEHVLREKEGWDRARVDALIAEGQWRQVSLDAPLDVFVLYGTAVADLDGTVRFFRDVYGHDRRLTQALDQAANAPDFKGAARWMGEYPSTVVQLTSGVPGRYPGE